ncbi:MDR family MFS transporter [Bacillus songklensis]|uniref:MDR family MFS transporter n=1 Tax=Bacillus songklensis TaxID=1069116 RepID=A0ABV8B052_9BACI
MRIRDWDGNLKVRLVGETVMNVTYWMFFPFLTIYFADAFGKEKAGFLIILSQFFSVAANLMGGYCADQFGRKKMMVFSALGQGIAFFIFAFSDSPWFHWPVIGFISFTLIGVFGSFYWPASQAMVVDVVDEEHRSHVFAVFYTSINIAVVVGPLLGALFYVPYRFQLIIISGIICILLALLLQKLTRETVPLKQKDQKANDTEKKLWYVHLKNQLADYGIILRDRIFLLFILSGVLVSLTFMQLDMLIPVYTKDVVENMPLFSFGDFMLRVNGEQAFGIMLAENGLFVALFTVIVTKWMTNFRERNIFIISSVVYGISIFLFGQLQSMFGLIFAMGLFTFAELMTAGIQQDFISKLAPEHLRGQYFATASLRYTVGRTIAPIFIPMAVWFGYGWTFAFLSFLALISAVLYYVMFMKYENQQMTKIPTP